MGLRKKRHASKRSQGSRRLRVSNENVAINEIKEDDWRL